MSIKITWHGHATFSLDIDGTKVVVDPFFAGNNPAAKTAVTEVEADFILQTHGHGDHIADTVALGQRTGATVLANPEILGWLAKQGHEKGHPLNTGGGADFSFGRVKMTPALHSSSLPDGSYGGDPGGYLLTLGDKKIYIAGDTALFSDMGLIGVNGLDLAILPIGDNYTMGPDDALLALEYLNPKAVVPCHYNTWPIISVDVDEWAARVKSNTAVEPIIAQIDHTFTI